MTRWASRSWTTWSCTIRLTVADPAVADAAAADLQEILAAVDAVASRFRPDSALEHANRHAGRPVPVPRALVQLVHTALAAAAQTDGAVDPTVGRSLVALGYDRDIALVRGRDLPLRAPVRRRADWRDVVLDRDAGLLTVPVGVALDLGATAKAATADHAAAALSTRYGTAVLVELGGDIAVAGTRDAGWAITVSEREGRPGQDILLAGGGLATSTTTVRTWRQGGQPVHHIVDPRSGRPAGAVWRTATVAAPGALAANVATTAALVMGEDAERWLAARGLAARLVAVDGQVRTVGGWPEPLAQVA